jgi:hypothetical protein
MLGPYKTLAEMPSGEAVNWTNIGFPSILEGKKSVELPPTDEMHDDHASK